MAAGIERFVSVVNGGGQARADVEWNVQPNHYDEIRPPQSLVVGRLFGAFLSVATVALVMAIAFRLRRLRTALVAGVLAAVAPALVSRAVFDMVDTMLAFFVTAAYLAGLSVDRARNRREEVCRTLLAGVLCGPRRVRSIRVSLRFRWW